MARPVRQKILGIPGHTCLQTASIPKAGGTFASMETLRAAGVGDLTVELKEAVRRIASTTTAIGNANFSKCYDVDLSVLHPDRDARHLSAVHEACRERPVQRAAAGAALGWASSLRVPYAPNALLSFSGDRLCLYARGSKCAPPCPPLLRKGSVSARLHRQVRTDPAPRGLRRDVPSYSAFHSSHSDADARATPPFRAACEILHALGAECAWASTSSSTAAPFSHPATHPVPTSTSARFAHPTRLLTLRLRLTQYAHPPPHQRGRKKRKKNGVPRGRDCVIRAMKEVVFAARCEAGGSRGTTAFLVIATHHLHRSIRVSFRHSITPNAQSSVKYGPSGSAPLVA
ncbi:hypothetical protein B0H14DRAFT_2556116 [Mycena olivaceomarginata]|nr:hypothetical protein B0H14DRAFT_2556116 [Mycena olivaceomarginata]